MIRKWCKPAAIKATQQVEEKAPQRRGGSPEVPRGQGVGAATRQGSQEPGWEWERAGRPESRERK